MKQYVIDELRGTDFEKVKTYFDDHLEFSAMDGIYWLPLARELLTPVQSTHTDCHPFCFALELEPTRLTAEFLVRTPQRIRCDCIAYATESQRNWLIAHVDAVFDRLEIIT